MTPSGGPQKGVISSWVGGHDDTLNGHLSVFRPFGAIMAIMGLNPLYWGYGLYWSLGRRGSPML